MVWRCAYCTLNGKIAESDLISCQDSRPFRCLVSPHLTEPKFYFFDILFLKSSGRMERMDAMPPFHPFSFSLPFGGIRGRASRESLHFSPSHSKMNFFATNRSASIHWPKIVYGLAFLRITAWLILIVFCLICFESSVTELNRIIKESRPHFDGLTLDQTRDFLIVYLIFGVLYVLIDGKQTFVEHI